MTREEYEEQRRGFEFGEQDYGTSTVELFPPAQLVAEQDGFEGDGWKDAWLVIGREAGVGDPIILDLESGRVLVAMHGEGAWDPDPIAASVPAFFAILRAFAEAAEGREDPVALEKKPMTDEDRERFLTAVRDADADLDPWWWVSLLYEGDPPG